MEGQTTGPLMSEALLTVNEVVDIFRISRSTLLRLEAQEKIPKHIKIGHRRLYRKADIENFIANVGLN